MRLTRGDLAPSFSGESLRGGSISLADYAGSKLWLCVYRYAACPFCSMRVHQLCAKQEEVLAAGVRWLVVFPSPVARIKRYALRYQPKFDILADPAEQVHAIYGAESSVLGDLRTAVNLPKVAKALADAPGNPLAVDGHFFRMPSEFLISATGRIERAFYGKVLDDGLPIPEVLAWARGV